MIRDTSIITGKKNLEALYTLKSMPVFMGCVSTPSSEDVLADMAWMIDPATGVIQLKDLIPLEQLYLNQHNDGVGAIWQNLYRAFAVFLKEHGAGKHILEIGGAHDHVARNYFDLEPDATWTIVEPNPQNIKNDRVKVIRGWFDDTFTFSEPLDAVIHSHVFEHTFNPAEFLRHIAAFLPSGAKHIFAFPNMLPMLEKKFTNCLNFEHTVFLTEPITEYLLGRCGFEIIGKEYYGDPHSIFYATIKREVPTTFPEPENHYATYKKVFMDFVEYHLAIVDELNQKIETADRPVYLFGAHIFSQYLFGFGLRKDKIISILDNSSEKRGKRLYGSDFRVESPKILAGQGKVHVILKAGIYNDEIKKDILENINSEVEFW